MSEKQVSKSKSIWCVLTGYGRGSIKMATLAIAVCPVYSEQHHQLTDALVPPADAVM